MIIVSGGAGFIGSNFILEWLQRIDESIVNLDLLTEAGNLNNLEFVRDDQRHIFIKGDICDADLVAQLLNTYHPRAILHFAAESHVDRSIHDPGKFVRTNVQGTFTLLNTALAYWKALDQAGRNAFRFLHVSTDEVYGSLEPDAPAFTESHPYQPNSPYSASKAASDHLVRAWHHTYGFPVVTTNCSNNYGPYQFPEKLIPLMIVNALAGKPLPIYGDGRQIRDWLYVADHCTALRHVLEYGVPGETYNIGGRNERPNIEIVHTICDLLDSQRPRGDGRSYHHQITYVTDRPGHDRRYSIDCSKIEKELGWVPAETFETGIRKSVDWYLAHQDWIADVQTGAYASWIERNYADRA